MRQFLYLLSFFLCLSCLSLLSKEDFKVTLEPTWQNFELIGQDSMKFGGRWVLVGSITFKKRSKEPLSLMHLKLKWHGKDLAYLMGSLYRYTIDKKFIPIEENLICDSYWNRKKQTLIFNFDEKETLNATTIFYLVLTIPDPLEQTLREGFFTLDEESLPIHFQEGLKACRPALSLNNPTLYARILPHVAISYTAHSPLDASHIS